MTNTTLWDSVCKTDPAHTKKFSKAGGFSGTAVKPFYLMHKATEVFGVCGIGWGWNELENQMIAGVWCSKVELWFVHNNQRGVIQQWGQTVMQGKNKHGDFVDEEAPKKAVTDAVSKCLSYLGFAGDIHMGRFDDSKYVDELIAEFSAETVKTPFANAALRKTFTSNVIQSFAEIDAWGETAEETLKTLYQLNSEKLNLMKESGNEHDALALDEIRKQYSLKKQEIDQAKMQQEQMRGK
jgi:hypothetical protein